MMASKRERVPMVSSLTMVFKRATTVTEDTEQAKLEHRANLRVLIDDYMLKLSKGEVDGIRNAKELVEVIKADMLLMGEATDRTETSNSVDEVRLKEVSSILDDADPTVQGMIDELFSRMNVINDEHGDNTHIIAQEEEEDIEYNNTSVDETSDSVEGTEEQE